MATDPEQQQQQQPLQPWESHSPWKITAPSRRVSIDFHLDDFVTLESIGFAHLCTPVIQAPHPVEWGEHALLLFFSKR